MRLRWTPQKPSTLQSLRDIDAIRRYIARDNPDAARAWVNRLQARASAATDAPLAGRIVPEADLPEVREVLLRTYRIVYRVHADELQVLTVFEGRRLLQAPDLNRGTGASDKP